MMIQSIQSENEEEDTNLFEDPIVHTRKPREIEQGQIDWACWVEKVFTHFREKKMILVPTMSLKDLQRLDKERTKKIHMIQIYQNSPMAPLPTSKLVSYLEAQAPL